MLYSKYKTLGAGTRQYYPAVERTPTSFVEECLYRNFYKFLSDYPALSYYTNLTVDRSQYDYQIALSGIQDLLLLD